MNTYYNNILIPVDDALNTQKALARATDLARPFKTILHLTQLIRTRNPFARLVPATAYGAGSKDALDSYVKTLLNLMKWKDFVEKNHPGQRVKIHIMRGPFMESLILAIAEKAPIDLIIIACDKTSPWLSGLNSASGNRLARQTHCAVLSLNTQKKANGVPEELEMLSEPHPKMLRNFRNDIAGLSLNAICNRISSN